MKPILYFPPINKLGNVAFRSLCLEYGADFIFTEMIRAEKYLENDEHQLKKAYIPKEQSKVTIVQIICDDISTIELTVDKLYKENPSIFEINYNMGCPQSSMCSTESGGGILGITSKVKQVGEYLFKACLKYGIKASIKMRLGLSREDISVFRNVKALVDVGISKIYIHGRVLGENYNKGVSYEEIAQVNKEFPQVEIIANGNVQDLKSLNNIVEITQCNSVLIGRAALEHPSLFKYLNLKVQSSYPQGYQLHKVKIEELRRFLELAKIYDVNLSYIKQNIAYMTKGLIKGGTFRFDVNLCKSVDEILDLPYLNKSL